jgi:hypothetical protein
VGCGGESSFVGKFGKVQNCVTALVGHCYAGVIEDVGDFLDLW